MAAIWAIPAGREQPAGIIPYLRADRIHPVLAQFKMDELLLYVGTYTHTDSEGIYLCRMDPLTGAVEVVESTPGIENPSFLIVDAARNRLFAVGEVPEYEGQSSGSGTS